MRVRLRHLVACALVVLRAGASEPRPITLGLIAPPTQPNSTSLIRGVQLAVDAANATRRGSVELAVRAESGQWGSVGNDAVVLITERHVDAMITSADGADAHLILQVSGRTRIPVASICPDSSVTGAGVPWAVRVVPRTDQEAEALFVATAARAGNTAANGVTSPTARSGSPSHWWAVIPPGRAGRAIRRDLETAARVAKTPVDRFLECTAARADVTSLAQAIIGGEPDGVLLWVPATDASALVVALRTGGFSGWIVGPNALAAPKFIAAAGRAADGLLVAAFRADPDLRTSAEKFMVHYQGKYDEAPDFTAVAGYDAANLLIQSLLHRTESDTHRPFSPAASVAGVSAPMHFDAAGNRTGELQILICQHGQFVPMLPSDS